MNVESEMSQNVMDTPDQLQSRSIESQEISLIAIWHIIWNGRWLAVLTTVIGVLVAAIYALSLPDQYESEILLSVRSGDKGGSLAGIASQFGGLAGIAGLNIDKTGSNKSSTALAVLKSRRFIQLFVNKKELKVPLLASKGWDSETGKLVIDSDVYNELANEWVGYENEDYSEPSDLTAYGAFSSKLTVQEDKVNGFVTVSFKFFSPTIAQQWVADIVDEINTEMKQRDIDEAKRNIDYLKRQLDKTSLTDIQTVFYKLVEEQTKALMMAEAQDDYIFKIIDPPIVPESRSEPRRRLIVVVGMVLGGLIGVATVFFVNIVRNIKNEM